MNTLSLNVDITRLIIYRIKKTLQPHNIMLNNSQIIEVMTSNFLEITFNKYLNWTDYISMIEKKHISKYIYIIKHFRNIFLEYILKLIYVGIVESKFRYGILVWSSSYQDIAVLQNKAVRAVTSAKYLAHTQPLFRKLDLLNIENLYNQSILNF